MSKKLENIAELAAIVEKLTGPVAVFGHTKPDGDALGSVAGMVGLLRERGLDAFALVMEPLPVRLKFIWDDVPKKEVTPEILKSCTLVALDSADVKRVGAAGQSTITLSIDHHLSHVPFGQSYYVGLGASSTAQIITELARELKVKLPAYALQGLYAGILTDSNRFAWGNAGADFAQTLEAAAYLVREGVPARLLSDRLTRTVTLNYLRLQGHIINNQTEFLENNQLAFIHAQAAQIKEFGCDPEDKDILLSVFQSIDGVQMLLMVLKDADGYRISTRGRTDACRMDLFCAQFGGGGHAAAAGAMVKTDEPMDAFLPRLRQALLVHWKAYGQATREL